MKIEQVAIQLYTLRDFLKTPEQVDQTIEKVAAIGYQAAQISGMDHGVMPVEDIVAAAEAGGCEWFIVEQDACDGDPFEAITRSFDYIRSTLVS